MKKLDVYKHFQYAGWDKMDFQLLMWTIIQKLINNDTIINCFVYS